MQPQYTFPDDFTRNFRIPYLLAHFIMEDLTVEEEDELEKWIQESDRNMEIFENVTDDKVMYAFMDWYFRQDHDKYLHQIKKRLVFRKPSKILLYLKYAAAACVVGLIAWAIYAILNLKPDEKVISSDTVTEDILPGRSMATLKLSNGSTVFLDEVRDSAISPAIRIVDGQIVNLSDPANRGYHELNVPRKGFYKLLLTDGTKVWINAASSLRYPASFMGSERRVFVTGEAYFEVARDITKPFIVSTEKADITALGTAFNVNAYTDEAGISTTLVEGKVRVDKYGRSQELLPGQQLIAENDNWKLKNVDTETYIAWTRNQFRLKNNSIEEVMRMVERWYDAKVVYTEKIDDHFTGTIDRNVPVSRLLKLLETTGEVHFSVSGETITVRK